MKKMKKTLSAILAASMVMSISMTAFAGTLGTNNGSTIEIEDSQISDVEKMIDIDPIIKKTYNVNNGTAPAETFTYKFEPVSYKNGDGKIVNYVVTEGKGSYVSGTEGYVVPDGFSIPAIADATTDFVATSATVTDGVVTPNSVVQQDEIDINIDSYDIGVYTYKVTEVKPTTLTTGVTYTETPLYLVLTILRDEASTNHYVAALHYQTATGEKQNAGFINSYNAGQLTVGKEIVGNMADMDKEFAFTVTFAAPAGTQIKSDIEPNSTSVTKNGLSYTFNLGDNDRVTFTNIPAGTTYTVTEDAENYTSDGGVWTDNGTDVTAGVLAKTTTPSINANDADTVIFTNTLTNVVDTGISLDNMPYIMVLALVALGLVGFVSKKRSMEF